MSDVSEPAVAREYMLGVNDFDRWCEDEPGRLSLLTDTDISASDVVKDRALLLRTWPLMLAVDPGRAFADRAEYASVCIRRDSWLFLLTV